MKKNKISFVALLALLLCIIVGGSVYMFNVSLRAEVSSTDENDAYAYLSEHEYLKLWVDSLRQHEALRDTFIIAPDGAQLHGLYVKAAKQTPNTALIIHGYKDNAIRMLMIGHLFSKELGYNILLPDLRGQGKSNGNYIGMGWKDRDDIMQWLAVSKSIYGDTTRIVLHGISMGAAAAMMVADENIPSNVKCIIEDCGYTSVWDEFSYRLKEEYGLPEFPILYSTSLYCKLKEGWSFQQASALERVQKCKLPMLFIHGDADTYVPTWMVHKLYEAKQGEKELWIVPGVVHAKAYWDYTDEYVKRASGFVRKYMK